METNASAPPDIAAAAEVLRSGGLVAFPTETVYGLGADATNPTAVRRIFAAKSRPENHPLIVHAASAEEAFRWAREIDDRAYVLAAAFWPGPLTLVLKRGLDLPSAATGGHDTVALRVPDHSLALRLLELAGVPVAAPSANRFGHVSPTTAEHVRRSLGAAVDLIVDGGPCSVGVESTIVGLTGPEPVLLRPGGLEGERIEAVLGAHFGQAGQSTPAAPGTLPSHYAPRCRVELVAVDEIDAREAALTGGGSRVMRLEPSASFAHDARELYARLRQADDELVDVILAVTPDPTGLGRAIADRLAKAAAPRES